MAMAVASSYGMRVTAGQGAPRQGSAALTLGELVLQAQELRLDSPPAIGEDGSVFNGEDNELRISEQRKGGAMAWQPRLPERAMSKDLGPGVKLT